MEPGSLPSANTRVLVHRPTSQDVCRTWVESSDRTSLTLSLPEVFLDGATPLLVTSPPGGTTVTLSWRRDGRMWVARAMVTSERDEFGSWTVRLLATAVSGEKRRHARIPLDGSLNCRVAGVDLRAYTFDVSVGGLRCELAEPLPAEIGAIVTVELDVAGTYVLTRARVVRLEEGVLGTYELALEFVGLRDCYVELISRYARSRAAHAGRSPR